MIPVHVSLERFVNTYSDLGPKQQGFRTFIADLSTPTQAIPYGFDQTMWKFDDTETRPMNTLLCVAFGAAPDNAVHFRKGLDLIIQAARALPDHRFTLVGLAGDYPSTVIPENVITRGTISPLELKTLLTSHSIYLQPSVMEGFPNALCEALLCGCLPIVSSITSMPSIIGDVGVVLQRRSAEDLIQAIRTITSGSEMNISTRRQNARSRVTPLTLPARITALEHLLDTDHQGKRDRSSLNTLRA